MNVNIRVSQDVKDQLPVRKPGAPEGAAGVFRRGLVVVSQMGAREFARASSMSPQPRGGKSAAVPLALTEQELAVVDDKAGQFGVSRSKLLRVILLAGLRWRGVQVGNGYIERLKLADLESEV